MTPPDPATIAARIQAERERLGSRPTVSRLTGGQLSVVGLKYLETHGNPTLATLLLLVGVGVDARKIVPELFDKTTENGS